MSSDVVHFGASFSNSIEGNIIRLTDHTIGYSAIEYVL